MTARALDAAEAVRFGWTRTGPAARVMAALEAAGPGASRFVGGCVRDSLAGVAAADIDIATALRPEEATQALRRAGLGVAPTGLAHGTVTAVADHVGVEVTTLRADVSTDGRRATVAYTDDWRTDAFRRDFTINALSLAPDLVLYDYADGAADLAARRVRFIGEASARIEEDFLRILRFFRFSARFADGIDAEGLAACAALSDGLARLSAERIGDELQKTLALPRALFAVEAMARSGVLARVWPAPADVKAFARLKSSAPDAAAATGLAALFGAGGEGIDSRLRLPNAVAARRRGALAAAEAIRLGMTDREARVVQYRKGETAFRDGLEIAAARADLPPPAQLLAVAATPAPVFPLSGRDVLAAGVSPGPRVAAALAAAEARWMSEDFPSTERARALLAEALAGES